MPALRRRNVRYLGRHVISILNRLSSPEAVFYSLVAFLLLIFALGGGSRHDIVSLAVLRPLSFLFLTYGFLTVDERHFRRFRTLILAALGVCLSVAVYLIPLPPQLWRSLPGFAIVAQAEAAAQMVPAWRPLSLDPLLTWNALFSLAAPLAVILLAIQLPRHRHTQLLAVLVVIGLASGILGVLQAAGPDRSALYFYRVTNPGAAVGLFSNRNHHAVFLAILLPVIATYAAGRVDTVDQRNRRVTMAAIAGVAIAAFVLNTGSRSGLIVGGLGAIAAYVLFTPEAPARAARRVARPSDPRLVRVGAGAVIVALLTLALLNGQAFERLVSSGGEQQEIRLQFWGPAVRLAVDMMPLGSGPGAFVLPFQVIEPASLLGTSYVNHAHNDWLELIATQGLLGLALLVALMAVVGLRAVRGWSAGGTTAETTRFVRLGAVVVALAAVGSMVDYPLRTPSVTAIFALALVWLWGPAKEPVD